MSFTFGRTTTTNYNGSASADNKYGGRFYLPQAGDLQSITMYLSVDAGGGAPVRFAVYGVSGNDPYALLGQTEAVTIPAGTGAHWRTLNFSTPVPLTAGYYYLAVHGSSSYLNVYRDDTGGLSNYNYDAYSDGFTNPWGGSNPGTKYYCFYGTLTEPNQAPYAPTLTWPTGGITINGGQPQTFTHTFGDPDPGDTQSAQRHRYRESGTSVWTTLDWESTPYSQHVFAAGTFTAGKTYEWQAQTKDNHGLEGPWSSSATFYVASPPNAPTITDPTNNQTISTPTYPMDWSIADQDAWQGRRLGDDAGSPDEDVVYEDTGTKEEPDIRTKTWTLTENNRTEHWQVRVRHDGLWGDWGSVKVNIAFTPPATPTLELLAVSDSEGVEGGYIKLTATHPTPTGGQPTVIAQDIFQSETDVKADAVRIAENQPKDEPFYARFIGDSKSYWFFVRAIGDNGATADSDLEG